MKENKTLVGIEVVTYLRKSNFCRSGFAGCEATGCEGESGGGVENNTSLKWHFCEVIFSRPHRF